MELLFAFIALVFAWPILTGVALIAVILVLLATEHEFFSAGIVIAASAFVIYGFYSLGQPIPLTTIAMWIGAYIVAGFVFTVPKWYLWAQKMGRKFAAVKKDFPETLSEEKRRYLESNMNFKLDDNEREVLRQGVCQPGIAGRYRTGVTQEEYDKVMLKRETFRADVEAEWQKEFDERFERHWNNFHSKSVMKIRKDATDPSKVEVFFEKPALVGYLTSWILNWPFYLALLLLEDLILEIVNWFADHIGKTFRTIATKAFNLNASQA